MGLSKILIKVTTFFQSHPKSTVREAASELELSKSTVGRHRQLAALREEDAFSDLWYTEEGYRWMSHFIAIVVLFFGIKHGIGLESLSYFFKLLQIDSYVGVSPNSLRRLAEHLEGRSMSYEELCHFQIQEHAPQREVALGVDETFFDRMILVAMDLASGFLFLETFSKERNFKTWQEATAHLSQWKIQVRLVVSDRAKALIKLSKKALECPHIPDLFHASHEICKLMGLRFSNQISQARKDLLKSESLLEKDKKHFSHLADAIGGKWIEQSQEKVARGQKDLEQKIQGRSQYRQMLQEISKAIHPFSDQDLSKQTASQVQARLEQITSRLDEIKKQFEMNDSKNHLAQFKKQITGLAQSVDCWWNFVEQSLLNEHLDIQTLTWLTEILLPVAYWKEQSSHCDHSELKKIYARLFQNSQHHLIKHPITKKIPSEEFESWEQWAHESVQQFQRASSAVEGRNGYLSQIYHNRRGLSKNRLHTLTIIHNFVLKRSDGTTAAQRLYRMDFPDFWAFMTKDLPPLPQPRKRKIKRKPNLLKSLPVPS